MRQLSALVRAVVLSAAAASFMPLHAAPQNRRFQ